MRTTLNDLFISKARVVYLQNIRKSELAWEKGSNNEEFHFQHLKGSNSFPKMPVILQSNGLPWKIGNAYLLGQLDTPELSKIKTLSARANHLKYYLQYLEDTNQHFLHLPKLYHERVTQKFKLFMKAACSDYGFSAEYINNILSTIAHFYLNIEYQSLIKSELLQNKPFTQITKQILTTNEVGFARSLSVITNDLKIKSSRKPSPDIGKLRDGGELRPLSLNEQQYIFEGFENNLASIELELMMRIALETGARQQTVCTLDIDSIQKAHMELNDDLDKKAVLISAGAKHAADTKGGRLNKLFFGIDLVRDLMLYMDCERAENRREKSFYKHTKDNYVFLTRDGNPYLTAQREIRDRQNPKPSWGHARNAFVPKNGQSLRNELGRFVSRIQKKHPDFKRFTFHDLRATSGMNIVRAMRKKNHPDTKIFDFVRQHLNHRNFKTTEMYLKFDSDLADFNDIHEAFEMLIYGHKNEG